MELDRSVFDGQPHNGVEEVDADTIFYSHKFIIEDEVNGELWFAFAAGWNAALKQIGEQR